jgi:hypothetical protein
VSLLLHSRRKNLALNLKRQEHRCHVLKGEEDEQTIARRSVFRATVKIKLQRNLLQGALMSKSWQFCFI